MKVLLDTHVWPRSLTENWPSSSHALRVESLPVHHKDPFDRLLVAQAQLEDCRLLSVDEKLRAYDVRFIHAGA